MRFYNRVRELERLNYITSEGKNQAHLVVLSGRRRVGKTEMVKHFLRARADFVYLFITKKKSHLLLSEFCDILSDRIPILNSVVVNNFESLFKIIFDEMTKSNLYVVLDEFQNFMQVDDSVFSSLQKLWDEYQDKARGAIICIGSVQTLMRDIFEGSKEPLFGRATQKISLKPLDVSVISEILKDNKVDAPAHVLFFYSLFGGVPKYYSLLQRHNLFRKSHKDIIRTMFCDTDALLQSEGRELLIEEFGKNYHLYFSILQTVASGATQMSQIADKAGIGINSISKYLDEMVTYYEVLERRLPVNALAGDLKKGRYHISDPLLKFWFRYIHKNQSLVAIGANERLAEKISNDLSTFMGISFENMVRQLLIEQNTGTLVPFAFENIGGYWDRNGKVEIDVVALGKNKIFFAECKLNGNSFSEENIKSFKAKAQHVQWGEADREEYFALITNEPLQKTTKKFLNRHGIIAIDLPQILSPAGSSDAIPDNNDSIAETRQDDSDSCEPQT